MFPIGGPSPRPLHWGVRSLAPSIPASKPPARMPSRRSPMSSPMPVAAPEIIRVRDLRKVYHVGDVDVPALRGVDLDVARGEFLAVIGPSGSGKSTLFHILGGLAPPTSGEIWIDGSDLRKMAESQRTE